MTRQCNKLMWIWIIFPVLLCCSCSFRYNTVRNTDEIMTALTTPLPDAEDLPANDAGTVEAVDADIPEAEDTGISVAETLPAAVENRLPLITLLPLQEIGQPVKASVYPSRKRPKKPSYDSFYGKYSRILGIRFDGTENKGLIREVAEWMGTPYLWGGCSESGVDCSCLIKNIYKAVYGIHINRTSRNIYRNNLKPVHPADLQEGDILCFKINSSRITHVGLYLKNGKFVHASRSRGVMISSLKQNYFRKYFFAAGRVISKKPMEIAQALPKI